MKWELLGNPVSTRLKDGIPLYFFQTTVGSGKPDEEQSRVIRWPSNPTLSPWLSLVQWGGTYIEAYTYDVMRVLKLIVNLIE
jgi:hypothetical protein